MNEELDYIIFKHKNSYDIQGLFIAELPAPSSPTPRTSKIVVPGRSGNLRGLELSGNKQVIYDEIEKDVKFAYVGENYDMIKRLFRGSGELVLSNQPDRFFKASIDNVIPFDMLMKSVHTFTISFSCFPYAYIIEGQKDLVFTPTTTEWGTLINNIYDNSLPLITIYGNGDIGLKINDKEVVFKSVDGFITCDSELMQVYKDGVNLGSNMVGDYPVLEYGMNEIQFTGDISKVTIKPCWRTI